MELSTETKSGKIIALRMRVYARELMEENDPVFDMGEDEINSNIVFGYKTLKSDFINAGRHMVYLRGYKKETNELIGHNSALPPKGPKKEIVWISNEQRREIWLYHVELVNIRLAGGTQD